MENIQISEIVMKQEIEQKISYKNKELLCIFNNNYISEN